ncbi:MAG TPA: YdbL family protein [Alphaproteobacteria bacterium]|nr:YdbL family protein [Alphaproteobacteria bacterium]HOO50296.1 YdbL family protein [Alphaproteobacteria bacterium]
MKNFRTFFYFMAAMLSLGIGAAVAADMDLATAKRAGLIGEKTDGLVAATLPNPSPDIMSLVHRTNKGRLAVYRDLATKQSIPVNEVQKIAAKKIFNQAESGEFLMIDGQWKQK